MALNQWLKSGDVECFDVDISNILGEMNIDGEESFVKLSETELDEFERKVTVARAQDLKDQKARMRLEKKLQKLRNIWTKGNGQNVMAKVTSPKGKAQLNENDEKEMGGHGGNVSAQTTNDALANSAGLKSWMKANNILVMSLFEVLSSKGITGADEENIAVEFNEKLGSKAEFDEVIRQVRVLRAEQLKDQKSKRKLEDKLTQFRKEWEKMTGIKSSTIQKGSKADQGKSRPDPKEAAVANITNEGQALRQWMKTTFGAIQKDLLTVLMNMNFKDPENLASMTQSEFDECVRQVKVARAKELKDQKAKTRMNQMLSKFEKAWRDASGIQKTTITQNSKAAKGQKKEKTEIEEKIDVMESSDLKKYMQKENFWEKDLFDELLAQGVSGPDSLAKLEEKEMEEIKRKVTVLRAKELKDQKSMNKLEAKLTIFEKEWREVTGIKKTAIKKGMKVTQGQKKTKAPKVIANEEMATAGKTLKNWLNENSVFHKDLYNELRNMKINDENDLAKIDVTQMDDLLRRVRVDVVSTLKDANTRKRVDAILVKFEKQWKALSEQQS